MQWVVFPCLNARNNGQDDMLSSSILTFVHILRAEPEKPTIEICPETPQMANKMRRLERWIGEGGAVGKVPPGNTETLLSIIKPSSDLS
uniref:Uncharacterized protein n=1 Tax=Steinernema glaseri TaxID=37863 RepID=A0A1I8A987_9BILA